MYRILKNKIVNYEMLLFGALSNTNSVAHVLTKSNQNHFNNF